MNSEHYFTLDSEPFLYTKPGDEMGDLWSEIFHFDGLEARREKFIFYGTEGKQQEFYGGFWEASRSFSMDEQFITCVTCLLRSLCYRIARLIAGINSQVHQLNSIPPAFKYYSGIYFYGVYIYCRCTYYTSHADSMIISRVCQPGEADSLYRGSW